MRPDRRGLALPLAFLACVLVAVVAMAVHQQIVADRYAFELVQGHRLVQLAASSAFEEAASRLEGMNRGYPLLDGQPPDTPVPDPGPATIVPSKIAPNATTRAFEPLGVVVGPVTIVANQWARYGARLDRNQPDRMLQQDLGILEFSVSITLKVAWTSSRHVATCRRYAVSAADTVDGRLQLHVQPLDMVLKVAAE